MSSCNAAVVHPQDGDNLKDALRYAAALLGELRTGELQPHRYFELYMQVTHHGLAWPVACCCCVAGCSSRAAALRKRIASGAHVHDAFSRSACPARL